MSGRAKILLLISLIFLSSAVAIFSTPIPAAALAADPTLHAHLHLLTIHEIAWLFTGVSVFGIVSSFFQRLIAWGYAAMMFANIFWLLLYVLSWIETGYWRTVFSATEYALIVGILWIGSSVVEIPKALAVYIHEEHGE